MGMFESKNAKEGEGWESNVELTPADMQLGRYEYPFENIVLEGGGAKGIAYHGSLKVLSQLGIFPQIKRFAGTSIGSIGATLLSVGYSPDEAVVTVVNERDKYLMDHSCGILSIIPNIVMDYGWNPGRKMLEWLGDKIEEKTGNRDITFKEVYMKYGKELCIVVTNVNQMDTEYCHVKTTPLMPIRIAVRMSVSIPGMYEPVKYYAGANTDLYIDGGLLVNFPIHCYDGWWLSLKPEDAYMRKLTELCSLRKIWDKRERFGSYNDKTIGILVYTGEDHEINEHQMNDRRATYEDIDGELARPETKLLQKKKKKNRMKENAQVEYAETYGAMSRFVKVLAAGDLDKSATIDRSELEQVFKHQSIFTEQDAKTIFGEDYTIGSVFKKLDKDGDGEISMLELIQFAEERGVRLWSMFAGYDRYEVNNVGDYLTAVQETVLTNVKRLYNEERDLDRTVAIYLDYIEGGDFYMEEADKIFAVKQGARAMITYLKHYVQKFNPPLKKDAGD